MVYSCLQFKLSLRARMGIAGSREAVRACGAMVSLCCSIEGFGFRIQLNTYGSQNPGDPRP